MLVVIVMIIRSTRFQDRGGELFLPLNSLNFPITITSSTNRAVVGSLLKCLTIGKKKSIILLDEGVQQNDQKVSSWFLQYTAWWSHAGKIINSSCGDVWGVMSAWTQTLITLIAFQVGVLNRHCSTDTMGQFWCFCPIRNYMDYSQCFHKVGKTPLCRMSMYTGQS